ncbi:LacI family DNA-binding transcriptional regulator [Solwaraspora sp. WMMD406]|uniref:LacI family DNA-binding transcriptional regulator n=1 Tax=Solwaraspora sp. WMMD406 TaxID=3016095 RepID=UPI00241723AB|nr:LacI family DNA-binding transcriptional regulator [Solwaraspora sp. WMMD406]MDG4764363.1 LacI family DNA-binding transcriptional regulator [Solwaraspora sp. WMMD406]
MSKRAPRTVTLQDVARAAGVSRATASRVIAGSGPASPATRERVHAAAARLGYTPDPVAKALVTGKGYRIAVAVAGQEPTVFDDPYVQRFVSAAAAACAPHGVGVSPYYLPIDSAATLQRLADDRSVHGVVLVNTTGPMLADIPAALRGRVAAIGVGSATVPVFDVDSAGGSEAVLRHLYGVGRRRIAMITGPEWLLCSARPVTAYRTMMRTVGLPARLVAGDYSAAGGRRAAVKLLQRWPDTDAIFAISDATALGALQVLRQRGITVPGDIAVAGFDDVPFAALSTPSLTTASHPVDQIAAAAATAVLAQTLRHASTVYPSELIVRESA